MTAKKAIYLIFSLCFPILFAQEWSEPIKLPEPINLVGEVSNYPFISRDGSRLYFSSNRNFKSTEDIYYCDKEGKGWGNVVRLNDYINTQAPEISASVTADGQTLYFCRYTTSGRWDIFYSRWEGDDWGHPVNIGPPVNTPPARYGPIDEQTACISAGGDTLVFGGPHYWETMYPPDLLYSVKTDTGWSYPKLFFTKYEGNKSREYEPWISANGKILFFQAVYHVDWERDIFFSKWDGEQWTMPINLGQPVNTEQAEMSPSLSPDGGTLYFARIYNKGEYRGGPNIWVSHRLIDGININETNRNECLNFSVYPNPSNSFFHILFETKSPNRAEIKIFDMLGKEVKTFQNPPEQTAVKTIIWNGTDSDNEPMPSGVYLCRITTEESKSRVIKLLLLK